jgi:predicted nucleic acid-binding protein
VRYLLDTCVISELVAKRPAEHVVEWVDALDPDAVYLSVITIGEIQKGIERLPISRRRAQLEAWLADELLGRFSGRVVPLDEEVLRTWGRLTASLEARGITLPAIDTLLAASALQGDFILVTRNEADFAATGVRLHNPWPRGGVR